MKKIAILSLLALSSANLAFATDCGEHPAETDVVVTPLDWTFSKAEVVKLHEHRDLFKDSVDIDCFFQNKKTKQQTIGQEFFYIPVMSLSDRFFRHGSLVDYRNFKICTPEVGPYGYKYCYFG